MRGRWWRDPALVEGGLFVGTFLVYLLTLCPGVYIHDSGELIAASWLLGIAHPAGSPLYLMAGKAFATLVPLGHIAFRYNLFSALCGAGTLVLLFRLLREVHAAAFPAPEGKGSVTRAALAAAVGLGLTHLFWSQALVAEEYTFNAFLLLWPLLHLFRWERGGPVKHLYLFGLLWGLLLGNHMGLSPVTPLLWLLVGWRYRQRTGAGLAGLVKMWFGLSLCFLATFSVYAYLPLRAGRVPTMDWGHPATLPLFWNHLTAAEVQTRILTLPALEYLHRLWEYLLILHRQFTFPLVAGLLVAAWLFRRRAPFVAAVCGLLWLGDAAFIVLADNAPIPSEAYAVPSVVLAACFLPVLFRRVPAQAWPIPAALPALLLIWNFQELNRSDNHIVADFAAAHLDACPPRAVLFSREDNKTFPLAYAQLVEGRRPDVTIVDRSGGTFRNIYGVDWLSLPPAQRQARIKAAEERVIRQALGDGRAVFYTDNYVQYPLAPDLAILPTGGINQVASPTKAGTAAYRFSIRGIAETLVPSTKEGTLDYMTEALIAMYALNQADQAWFSGHHQQALALYDRAGKETRSYSDLHFILGQTLLRHLETDAPPALRETMLQQAEAEFRAALAIDFHHLPAGAKLAYLLARTGRWEGAAATIDQVLRYHPDSDVARFIQGNIRFHFQDLPGAVAAYRQATRLNPAHTEAFFNLGLVLRDLGKPAEARRAFQRALQIDPNFLPAAEQLSQLPDKSRP